MQIEPFFITSIVVWPFLAAPGLSWLLFPPLGAPDPFPPPSPPKSKKIVRKCFALSLSCENCSGGAFFSFVGGPLQRCQNTFITKICCFAEAQCSGRHVRPTRYSKFWWWRCSRSVTQRLIVPARACHFMLWVGGWDCARTRVFSSPSCSVYQSMKRYHHWLDPKP